MYKVLFVGRTFHIASGSANFFLDFIAKDNILEKWYPESDVLDISVYIEKVNMYDYIICWQSEHMSLLFSSLRLVDTKVINISMFDGIEIRNDLFFKQLNQCININFSYNLHKRFLENNGKSHFFQYYPKLSNFVEEKENSVFFWEREPHHISCNEVIEIFSGKVDKIYLHRPISLNKKDNFVVNGTEIILSDNIPSKDEFFEYMSKSKFFVTPRLTEGIGMSFLDAMSCGMIPIGYNKPTYNEYVENNVNGIVYNSLEDLKNSVSNILNLDIKEKILNNLQLGYEQYNLDLEQLWSKINSLEVCKSSSSFFYVKVIEFIKTNYRNSDECFDFMDRILND